MADGDTWEKKRGVVQGQLICQVQNSVNVPLSYPQKGYYSHHHTVSVIL
ncbi:MAG: hypothetical protein MUP30_08015 [Deltaproteobacteria bacterium]|nr:hypothetical protein [Deltaproteobacteria bacterium]